MGQAQPESFPERNRNRDSPTYETEDFGAEFTPELRKQEERLREQLAAKK